MTCLQIGCNGASMRYIRLLVSLIGLGCVGAAPFCGGDIGAADINSVRVRRAVSGKNPCERLEKAQKDFSTATKDEIQRLKIDRDDSIAVRAAWEEVRRPLPKHDESLMERSPSMAVPVQGMPYFLGFLEGRLRIPLPAWWAAEMKVSRAYDRDWLIFFRGSPPGARADNSRARGIPADFGSVPTIAREGKGDVIVSWGQQRLRVAGDTMPFVSIEAFSGIVFGNRCLVAHFHMCWPNIFDLYCIDFRTAEMVWSTNVWLGCSRIVGATGPGSHSVTLVVRNGVAYVFGMANDVAYIDGFALSDGRNEFHFSTTHMSE
jgi:hypothetical protein